MMLRTLVLVVATAFSLGAGAADRVLLHLVHEYVDFVDRGTIDAYFRIWPLESRFGCLRPSTDTRSGNRIALTSIGGDYADADESCWDVPHVIGTLAAGTYEVTARVLRSDGTLFAESMQVLNVAPSGGRCNPAPGHSGNFSTVFMQLKPPLRNADVAARLNSDPLFAAALGNPAAVRFEELFSEEGSDVTFDVVTLRYPPLFNLVETRNQISDAFPWFMTNQSRAGSCLSMPAYNAVKTNVEYFYPGLDYYFYTNDEQEIENIATTVNGIGWERTGKSFSAEAVPNCTDGQTAVYRFWGIPGVGPNSHFFTRDPAECSIVDQSKAWTFESVAFWASQPNADGSCNPLQYLGQNRIPLYRAWRPFGKPSHRLSTDRAVINEMVAKGWVDEGAVMCVLPPG